jgi:hypothetical protein
LDSLCALFRGDFVATLETRAKGLKEFDFMPVPGTFLKSNEVFEHAAIFCSSLLLAGVATSAVVVFIWFAVRLWAVEDGVPHDRLRIAILGALVAMIFIAPSVLSYLRESRKAHFTNHRGGVASRRG